MDVLDPLEIAERLNVDRRTVYKLLHSGELRGRRVGRVWRVTEDNLRRFLDGGEGLGSEEHAAVR